MKIQKATFPRIKTNVPGFLRIGYRSAKILGRLSQIAGKWQVESQKPLFTELRQTSQVSCEPDIDPRRFWDVCPDLPKSGKSIFPTHFPGILSFSVFQNFRISKFQNFRISEFQTSEFQNFEISV